MIGPLWWLLLTVLLLVAGLSRQGPLFLFSLLLLFGSAASALWARYCLAGIGYRSYLGENAAVDIVGLYNFDNTISSLYPPLVVRFSFLFNFGK